MQVLLPDRVKFENNMFATRDEFKEWLNANREVSRTHILTHLHQNCLCGFAQVLIDPNLLCILWNLNGQSYGPKAANHGSSPFVAINGQVR